MARWTRETKRPRNDRHYWAMVDRRRKENERGQQQRRKAIVGAR